MVSLEEAQKYLLDNSRKMDTEIINICDSHKRVLAEDIHAPFDNPPFNKSPLDGYAVMAEDLENASKENPAIFKVIDKVYAGYVAKEKVTKNTAIRIMTGAPIPDGANCVVRQENTERDGDVVKIFESLKPYDNFCYKAEDFKAGTKILEEGEILDSSRVMSLASLGFDKVKVYKKVRVGIITTGDEIQTPGTALKPGKIYNSNGYFLYTRLIELGADPVIFNLAKDDSQGIQNAMEQAFDKCDILVTTGGVSVGEKDLVKESAKNAGYEILFWKVNIKPGSPMFGAVKDGKLLIGLSGTPVAASTTFELTVRPILSKMINCNEINLKQVKAIAEDEFTKVSGKRRFLRVKIEQKQENRVYIEHAYQSPGQVHTMLNSNAILEVKPKTSIKKGDLIEVIL
ncbi:MAG: molybdopterin molybdotransferase MoeA [Sarcina ventriculi]|uniref:Molybdopterin molybdenumtransferase n=1 Tax=Sarcina ventriculi TaxID=1267 RepID=A0ABP2ATH1_SARVE|nr:gephyrin-like molybdotransferase Glp [Sarcina ventriculi]MCI5635620.1 molybdopterin molybdotransferase MoeA [Sarcina ventriculi]MDD7373671.1 molybdopterin molybdotransferase MoeA [Sarcina ventriculi]MDY7062042.1 molybdopterin molybdotransferase MoeA [Sarcina ventriculi]CUN88262.1 Molybdopterin molybdenumtransferase [Sarcina ventriculi]